MARKKVKQYLYGERLDQVMQDRKIKPEALAKALNITTTEVQNWLYKDRSQIPIELFAQICEILTVKEKYLCCARLKPCEQEGFRDIPDIIHESIQTKEHYGEIAARKLYEQTKIIRTF